MLNQQDLAHMQHAFALAQGVLPVTGPNPRVGCVIVQNDQVIGQGATSQVGAAHAEINAIQSALDQGHSLVNATVYVSLEPCSHFGRTPPCVNALIAAKPARVVVANLDPSLL